MSNKSVPAHFYEVYGKQHNVEAARQLFAADATIYSAQGALNLDTFAQGGSAFLAGFSDLQVEVLDQIEEGEKVVSRVVWSGTHTGDLYGIPPTGRSFRSESITIDRIVNSRIQERWEAFDMLGMMQKLGVIPTPGA